MISFIVPFAANNGELKYWPETDTAKIILTTINCIRNINRVIEGEKEIILVDNTNNFPSINLPNLRIVKGLQYLTEEELKQTAEYTEFNLDNLQNQTMWASMAYNVGLKYTSGKYIVLQHNDIAYHNNLLPQICKSLDRGYSYFTVDFKKLSLSAYCANKEEVSNFITDYEIETRDGGYIKTKEIGFADAYFFIAKRDFFKDYKVDWGWNDTNHGATVKCMKEKAKFVHIGPYYDNPNFKTDNTIRTYRYKGKDFLTHLKGGFSEMKLTGDISFAVNELFKAH